MLRRGCRDARELAILETLYSTGCRVSELTGILLSDIDWPTRTVHLLGKGKKHRSSYLNAKAEVAIREYLHQRKHASISSEEGGVKIILIWLAGAGALALALARFIREGKGGDE